MDILVLLGSFAVLCALGVPVAYALGLSALDRGDVGRHPARSGDAQDLGRHRRLRAAGDPVLRAGGRHHGRRRHGDAPRQPREGVRRLHSRRPGAGQHPRQHALRLHLGLVGRRHGVDRLGDDSADGEGGLPARVRHQRHDLRLGAGADDPAVAQRRHLLAGGGRHDLGRASVPRRHLSRPAVRAVPDRARAVDGAQARLSEGRAGAAERRAEDRHRRAVGPGHRRHHHGRHSVRRLHADRVGGGRLRVRLPGDVPRLPRLQVARAAAPGPPRRSRPWRW